MASSGDSREGRVHEIVLGVSGGFTALTGVARVDAETGLKGLVDLVRRAGNLPDPHELSFYWRGDTTRQFYATIRSGGSEATTSLTWIDDATIPYGITWRELEVLTLLVGGLTNPEIAARLWMSTRTASTHVERLLGKLSLSSRSGAAALALEQGLVLLPIPGGSAGFEGLLMGKLSSSDALAEVPASASHGTELRPSGPFTGRRPLKRSILLGSAFPVDGEVGADGIEMLRATQMAVDEVNSRGGISGRRVELINVGFEFDDARSTADAFAYLAEMEVDALASGYIKDQRVAHTLAAEVGAPYLHAATLDSMVRMVDEEQTKYRNVFQLSPSDTLYAPGFVRAMTFLRDSGQLRTRSNTLAMIRGSWLLGDMGFTEAVDLAHRSGWSVVYVDDDVSGAEPWRSQARHVAQLCPDAVLVGSYLVDDTMHFIRAFQKDPSSTLIYSIYAPSIPRFRMEMGHQAEGLLWATTTGTYSDQLARRFIDRYRSTWAVSPGRSHAGIAYDRVRMLASAWANTDSPRDFAAVNDWLRQNIHRGVNGAYSFSEHGQVALSYPLSTPDPSIGVAHLVFQIQDNRQRILHPSPYAETRLRRPPWWPDRV